MDHMSGRDPPEESEKINGEADITMWLASNAPRTLTTTFTIPVPPNATIIKLSAEVVKDAALEKAVVALFREHLVTRAQLADGGVALLYSPDHVSNDADLTG